MSHQAKSKLFDSSDESSQDEPIVNVENSYAQKYNDWRRKEELQKLKDKYGEDNLDIMSEIEGDSGEGAEDASDSEESSSSESLQEDEIFDDNFFKIYSAIKTKDPKVYDKSFQFFSKTDEEDRDDDEEDGGSDYEDKSPKETKKLTLPEYHRKLIEEKQGITEEDQAKESESGSNDQSGGYYEELWNIRKEIKDITKQNDDDSDNEGDDVLFSVKGNSISKQHISSPTKKKSDATETVIFNIWNNEKTLDEKEKFLKDYILNKRYLDGDTIFDNSATITNYKNVESHFGGFDNCENSVEVDDEEEEQSHNRIGSFDVSKFHFEEPDALVIKRYPRAIDSIRDMARKEKKTKRADTRERKKKEKQLELKQMRKLKREEYAKKIEQLKSITGSTQLDINDLDLNVIIDDENDFDPDKYDQKMKLIFGDDYYNEATEKTKPKFEYIPSIDDDDNEEFEPSKEIGKKSKKELKRKRDIMADDDIGTYDDLIGGEIATRFRYRMVEPNDFGLTDQEILLADDKELNKWCSLKKTSQYRSAEEETYDQKVYEKKKGNFTLKKKVFQSIYGNEDQAEEGATVDSSVTQPPASKKRGKKRRKKKGANGVEKSQANQMIETNNTSQVSTEHNKQSRSLKRKRKSNKTNIQEVEGVTLQRLKAYGMSKKDIKRLKSK